MKQIIGIFAILLLSLHVQGQQRQGDRKAMQAERAERVRAIKVGYITDKLKLTAQQATAFWPIYDEYQEDMQKARKAFRQKYRDEESHDDNAEAKRYIEDNLELQEQTLAIKRKYKDRMLKVISAQQLASLYEAERDFKKLLVQQLSQRRAGNMRGQGMRR